MAFTINKRKDWLESDDDNIKVIAKKASKNKTTFEKLGQKLDTIVIHFTADGRGKAKAANYLQTKGIEASAHLVIEPDGKTIYQLVAFDTAAWHAGKSEYGGRKSFNNFSIGIEIDNAGKLFKEGDEFVTWFGGSIPQDEVEIATHRNQTKPTFWHKYNQAQIDVCKEICKALIDAYDIKYILGHEEIAPVRKIDPGPLFPLGEFRRDLLNTTVMSAGNVSTASLNIRSGPGGTFKKVARPLSLGQKVEILEEKNGWYMVRTSIEGWVSKKFIETKEQKDS